MKKAVAFLLTAAMVMSLVGCSKEETTKKKKKTKKTTAEEETDDTTDEPTDDPTDAPTETSEDPTTTTSESTSDTSSAPQGSSVERLHTELGTESIGYKKYDQYGYMTGVMALMEYPLFSTYDYMDLQDAVYSVYDELESLLVDTYYDSLDKYLSDPEEGKSAGIYTDIFRDDSYIFSFSMECGTTIPGIDQNYMTHTYWSATGEEIKLSDVVTDTDALLSALKDYSNVLFSSDETVSSPDFVSTIEDGTCPFTLTYDGICIFLDYTYIKIPVSAIPNAVNYRYFGYAPDSYFLMLDAKGEIEWDFDQDGIPESFSVEGNNTQGTDEYFVDQLIIHHNGNDYTLEQDVWGEMHLYDENYILVTPDGIYLYMLLGVDEGIEYIGFAFENGTWTGLGSFENGEYFYGHAYDPNCVVMGRYFGVLGTHYYYGDYSFEGTNGRAVMDPDKILYYTRPFFLETRQEITVSKLDDDYNPVEDVTLLTGTCINVLIYDPEFDLILCEVCYENPDQNYYVSANVSASAPYTVSDVPVDDAFNGIVYAG